MTEFSTIIAVSVLAYLATNLDNLVILTTLLAKYPEQRAWVLGGHLLAVALTLAVAGTIGEAANAVSVRYLGYLGVVPIAMGLFWWYRLLHPVADAAMPAGRYSAAVGTTFFSMLSNSTDTLLTQAIVFADTAARFDWLVAASVLAAAFVLAAASGYGVRDPRIGPWIERHAVRIAPVIMIAVGLYVLANTTTDVVQ